MVFVYFLSNICTSRLFALCLLLTQKGWIAYKILKLYYKISCQISNREQVSSPTNFSHTKLAPERSFLKED